MKLRNRYLIAGLLLSLLNSSQTFGAGAEVPANVSWKVRMQAMMKEALILFPFAFNDEKFNDPKNAPTIHASLDALVKYSEELKGHASHFKREEGLKIDPSFPFIAEAFESELIHAQSRFDHGADKNKEAQGFLRSAIAKCMLCHSQTSIGPELELDPFKPQFAALSVSDRFLAFTATRQFDKALGVLEDSAKELKQTKPKYADLDRSTRAAIAILVRVKRDPKRAVEFIDKMTAVDTAPSIYKNDLKGWKKSLLAWQAEKPVSLTSARMLFEEATKIKQSAEKAHKLAPNYENVDVPLLRSTGLLHDLLSNYPKSEYRAKSYMMLASNYEALPGFAIWDLSDEYLGACIQENPHSEVGEKCFRLYDESITLGYSGSSGTHIPDTVKEQLARLKKLATRI